jgi:hypothetical protein
MTVFALCAAMAPPAAAAEVNMYDGQWHYQLTPYGWFPSISGDLDFTLPSGGGGSPSVKVNPSSYLKDLQFAAMFYAEARKGSFALFTDVVYADIASLKSTVHELRGPNGRISLPVNVDVNVGVKELVWTAGAQYTLIRNETFSLDALAGVRYGSIKSSLDANSSIAGSGYGFSNGTTQKVNLWDGIVGVQGKLLLGDDKKWFVPYELDIGAGSNNWVWNGIIGIGYRFDWGNVLVAYRNLDYRMTGDELVQNLQMSGPAIGLSLQW